MEASAPKSGAGSAASGASFVFLKTRKGANHRHGQAHDVAASADGFHDRVGRFFGFGGQRRRKVRQSDETRLYDANARSTGCADPTGKRPAFAEP